MWSWHLQHGVARLVIPMDDAFLVRRVERFGQLPGNREGLGDRQRSARGDRQAGLHQLENQRRHPVDVLEAVIVPMRMIERG